MAEEGPESSAEDRTEAATPRRIERAREEGQVALSREAVVLAALAGGTLAAAAALPPLLRGGLLPAMGAVLAGAGHALDWRQLRRADVAAAWRGEAGEGR